MADDESNEHVGFFERRWRMVKAAAKQTYEYLFDIKTYVTAAVMLGAVAMIDNPTLSSFFGMQTGAGIGDIALRAVKFIGMSALIRTAITMGKESYACNDCNNPAPTVGSMEHTLEKGEEIMKKIENPLSAVMPTANTPEQFTPPSNLPPKVAQTNITQPPRF